MRPEEDGDSPSRATLEVRHGWIEQAILWLLDRRLIALLLGLLLVLGGVFFAPFRLGDAEFERAPLPVDAIPDVGENQQIVFTEWAGRSPRDIEDQITYPLTSALLGLPGVKTVRSSSAFGFSTIYVIFQDDVEFYWSRSRILEKLSSLANGTLPEGVTPTLGPDATGLGQIFWYTLEGHDAQGRVVGGFDPDELRSIQDWTVRYALQSVDGVSEVASVGGFVREYQVDVDPEAMRAHRVALSDVADAVRRTNLDVGARTLEINRVEYLVRGLGFAERLEDLEQTVVAFRENTPIRVRDVARVAIGPALRRGALDDEGAPAVGGVVVARFRENPLGVIDAVKKKIKAIEPGLPRRMLEDGTVSQVKIVPFYDRTHLIFETLGTLSTALFQQILITIIVVLIMLRHVRSSILVSLMLPLGVLFAFVAMKVAHVDANIMALGGIAIAIGTMVDISIVFVENIYRHWGAAPSGANKDRVIATAIAEVAPAVMTSTLTTVVSFLPVFGLTSAEFRLFAPLAFSKTFAMLGVLFLALLLLPGLSALMLRPTGATGSERAKGRAGRLLALFSRRHLRDLCIIALGIFLCFENGFLGSVALVVGTGGLFAEFLPDRIVRWRPAWEMGLIVIAVGWLLSVDWMPLGLEAGMFQNALFVGVALVLLLGAFLLFERVYPHLLQVVLSRKRFFLLVPTAFVFVSALCLLGAPRLFGFLPEAVLRSSPMQALSSTFPGLGRQYMPPFDEGSFLYMPSTMPHASFGQAQDMLSDMDAAIATIPEVDRVVGKLGRSESALDPAPVSMFETVITLHPKHRTQEDGTRVRVWRPHIETEQDIWEEIARVAQMPGLTSAPRLMPIGARLVMLQSGMRAPLGIKIHGPRLEVIEAFGIRLSEILKEVPALQEETVFADRALGKPYLEIDLDREAIGRFGLTIVDVQTVLQTALGGVTLSQTVEGRERYPIRVRYMREERDSIEALERVLIPTSSGAQIPLQQIARIEYVRGPQMIKSEDTFLTTYVLFDKQADIDEMSAIAQTRKAIDSAINQGTLRVPDGVSFEFAGSYQNQLRSEARLRILVPLALCLVFMLIYLQFRRVVVTLIIFSGALVAVSGGVLILWFYGQPWFLDFSIGQVDMRELFSVRPVYLSVAVWVGFIALLGVATDDGVVMSTYLKQRFDQLSPRSIEEVRDRIVEAGTRRIRPCLMTTATTILALLPVVTSRGRGSEIMVAMALPLVGGMLIELMTLFVVPILYAVVEERRMSRTDQQSLDASNV